MESDLPSGQPLPPFFDVPAAYRPRLAETVETCAPLLQRMRDGYSPVDKLDALLAAIRVILNSVRME